MSTLSRYRILVVLCAAISGILFTWQADIANFVWRMVVAGFAAAFAGAALLFYAHVVRQMK